MVSWGKVTERFDPVFYLPEFLELIEAIVSSGFTVKSVSKLTHSINNGFDCRNFIEQGLPYAKVAQVRPMNIDLTKAQSVAADEIPARGLTCEGEVLLTRKGSYGIAALNRLAKPIAFSSEVFRLKPRSDLIDGEFAEILLNLSFIRKQFDRNKIGAIMGSLTQKVLRRVYLPLPDLALQRRLLAKFKARQESSRKKMLESDALLVSIDDYLLAELGITLPPEPENTIGKRMFRTNASDLGGWRFDARVHQYEFNLQSATYPNAKLGTICAINPKTVFRGLTEEDDVSFVPMDAISDRLGIIEKPDTRVLAENVGYTSFREGDLLWAKITPCMENGKSAVAEGLHRGFGYGSTEYHVLRSPDGSIDMGYLHALLRMKRVRKAAVRFFTGSSGHQRVDADFLRTLELPVPPLEKQKALAAEARERVEKAVNLEKEANAELENAKQDIEAILLGEAV